MEHEDMVSLDIQAFF